MSAHEMSAHEMSAREMSAREMSARDTILSAIRRRPSQPQPRPTLNEAWIRYENPLEQFAATLQSVGGQAHHVDTPSAINRLLADLPAYQTARRRCSLVAGVGQSNVDPLAAADPHQLEALEFAVLPGQFAVAENAAVWVTNRVVRHQAIYYLTQHLALVVRSDQLVHNMHEAYARLSFAQPEFGCFISGPSKTADIEQSLVIGAHGPRSLAVFLVDDLPE